MNIKVNIKQIGSRKKGLAAMDFPLENRPETVGELIKECVHTCVEEYNERVRRGENITAPLDDNAIQEKSIVGKIAFGINYGGRTADPDKAVKTALQAYEDGLFRIFINDKDVGDISDKIELNENDSVTFIRLVMLAGGIF